MKNTRVERFKIFSAVSAAEKLIRSEEKSSNYILIFFHQVVDLSRDDYVLDKSLTYIEKYILLEMDVTRARKEGGISVKNRTSAYSTARTRKVAPPDSLRISSNKLKGTFLPELD